MQEDLAACRLLLEIMFRAKEVKWTMHREYLLAGAVR